MGLWATEEVENAERLLSILKDHTDENFVKWVKVFEYRYPELRILNCWMDGVRRDLDMRLLLKH